MARAQSIFDENFLAIRAKLIEVAAMLDRLDRVAAAEAGAAATGSAQSVDDDPRRARVEEAIGVLLRSGTDPGERAAKLQQIFSRQYDPRWREQFGL